MKKHFLFLLMLLPLLAFSQDLKRVTVNGKINVPKGEDAEGISVYNLTSQKGTVTGTDGTFKIAVAANDRLEIYALQYQSFTVVIDKRVMDTKKLNIFVNPSVTQLEEVVVHPYDLTGNIEVDVNRIPTNTVGADWDLSYETISKYTFQRDRDSPITINPAEEALNHHTLTGGLNFINLFGSVGNLLFPNKKLSEKERLMAEQKVSNNMVKRYNEQFIQDNFDIPRDKAYDFIFYVQEEGLDRDLLEPENELELMKYLREKSLEYKKLGR